MSDIAVAVQALSKEYYLYRRPIHRVLETLLPLRKPLHTSFPALSSLSFTVERGESIGIIGRNGSGKSTLLQIICGNLQPTAGSVDVRGRISALLELGAGFNPEFTGRENVYLNTAILGLSHEETDARFGQIAAFAEIGEFIDRPVKMFSSGMYVRLAFATAISIDPDILIVDEALAVGDIFFQQKCMKYMKQMMEPKTIVLVSHDMHAVSSLCSRVVVLERGRMIYDGPTDEGIALYTRIVHNEIFARQEDEAVAVDTIPEEVITKTLVTDADFHTWKNVESESRGGAGGVIIHKVSVTKNDSIFKTVQQGETVQVRMLIFAHKALDEVIFGYTVKDRVGIALFGENSVSLLAVPPPLAAGFSVVRLQFVWPEVCPQEYTLTLGIGEGRHAFDHTIQCWAHNVVSFTAITPGRYVHGMFNNKLTSLQLHQVQ